MTTILPASDRIIMCEQGSADWFTARCGCVTSSRIAAVVTKRKRVKEGEKAEPLEAYKNMKWELVYEMLTGKAMEHYVSPAMENGRQREPIARAEYEVLTGLEVQQVGLVYHPVIPRAAASPDGFVGPDGLLEIKCPTLFTHFEYLERGEVPEEYHPQMLWQMACCERPWVDFVSYFPDLPEPHNLFIKRFEATKERLAIIRGYELEVEHFLAEVDKTVEQLKHKD